MQKNSFKLNPLQIAGIVCLVGLFAAIRLFESKIFYDPFLDFFKYERKVFPEYNAPMLYLNLGLRYVLNTLVSLVILWLVFKDMQIIKLTTILYIMFFVVLCAALYIVLSADAPNQLAVFYVRRFLIQPLFLLLFLPAFYYQKHMK